MAQTLLGRIVIKNGTFFSSYATNDVIEVYYDDTLEKVRGYKNQVEITTGFSSLSNVTTWHVSNNYATVYNAKYSFCDGNNLVAFGQPTFSPTYPYFLKTIEENSPTCAVNVCDILFDGSPTVVNASIGGSDGSITVKVFSSSVVRFKIGESGIYDSMISADSVNLTTDVYTKTFSNLSRGNYGILAIDATGCKAYKVITVGGDILGSYGAKYYFDFKDWQDVTHLCTIKEKNYTGTNTELTSSGETPVRLNWGSTTSQDSLANVLGGSILIELISVTDQQWVNEFSAISERQFLAEITQSTNVIQRGYIVPEIYEEPYVHVPYAVQIRAVDGLADLSNYTYTNDQWTEEDGWQDGQRLTGDDSIIDILAFCLSKTGLKQNIRSGINTYADEHDTSAGDDPLKQTYINNDCFVIDDRPLTCLEVIERVLLSLPEPAKIFSAQGYWWIWPIEQKSATVDYREFTDVGVYSSNGTVTSRIDIDSIINGANQRFESVYNSINVIEERQLRDNIAINFNSENITNQNLPQGWTPVLNGESGRWEMDGEKEYLLARFSVLENGQSYITTKLKNNNYNNANVLQVKINYQIVNNLIQAVPYIKVKTMIKAGDRYLSSDGNWYDYEILNEQIVRSFNSDNEIIYDATFDTVGTNSDIEIRLYSVSPYESDFRIFKANIQPGLSSQDIDDWKGTNTALPLGYKLLIFSTEEVGGNLFYELIYYTLQRTRESSSGIDIISTTASIRDNTTIKWIREETIGIDVPEPTTGQRYHNFIKSCFVKYKDIDVNITQINPQNEEKGFNKLVLSDDNVKRLDYPVYFFDIVNTVANAENRLQNYWKLSNGNPISLGWNTPDGVLTNTKSQFLVSLVLGRLFKFPTKTIVANGRQDNHIYPYHTMRITYDNNTVFQWNRLEWNMKLMQYNGELSALYSDTAVSLKAYKDNAYSNGYS